MNWWQPILCKNEIVDCFRSTIWDEIRSHTKISEFRRHFPRRVLGYKFTSHPDLSLFFGFRLFFFEVLKKKRILFLKSYSSVFISFLLRGVLYPCYRYILFINTRMLHLSQRSNEVIIEISHIEASSFFLFTNWYLYVWILFSVSNRCWLSSARTVMITAKLVPFGSIAFCFHHRCILVYLTKLLHTSFVSSILVVKSTKR